MKFSELTPRDLFSLRILAAIEPAYPDHKWEGKLRRPSTVIAGYDAWRKTPGRRHQDAQR
jgi:hypothetical protein